METRRLPIAVSADKGAASATGDRVVSVDLFLRLPDGTFPEVTDEVLRKARLAAFRGFGDKLREPGVRQGIVVMGLPCSGKSRLVAELSKKHPDTVFFEATLSTHQERLSLMHEARGAGIPVHLVHVHENHAVVMSRNATREGNRRLSNEAMRGMIERLGTQPPSVTEGFSSITKYSSLLPFEQLIKKFDRRSFSGLDAVSMSYVSPADPRATAKAANPIPLLGALFSMAPDAHVGIVQGPFDRCHNADLKRLREAADATNERGEPRFTLIVVAPLAKRPGEPELETRFDANVDLLRLAVAADPRLARRVVISDAHGRVPGFPHDPARGMQRLIEVYNPKHRPGRFSVIEGDASETSAELRAALEAGDLTSIADKVPPTTLQAMKAELAVRGVPLLQNFS
ncbi:MAG: hypothetical protein ACAI38_12385 [Myxococcota bacterium]|nr:hypothetical protein [Myxococcota bacterium]